MLNSAKSVIDSRKLDPLIELLNDHFKDILEKKSIVYQKSKDSEDIISLDSHNEKVKLEIEKYCRKFVETVEEIKKC